MRLEGKISIPLSLNTHVLYSPSGLEIDNSQESLYMIEGLYSI